MTPTISMYNAKIRNFVERHDIYIILYSEDISADSKHSIYFIHHSKDKFEHEEFNPAKEFLVHRLLEYCKEEKCVDSWAEYALRGLSLVFLYNKYGFYNSLDDNFQIEMIEHDSIPYDFKKFILGYLSEKIVLTKATLERFSKMYDIFEMF